MYLSIEKAPRKTPFDLCFALSISRFYPLMVFSLLNAPGGSEWMLTFLLFCYHHSRSFFSMDNLYGMKAAKATTTTTTKKINK